MCGNRTPKSGENKQSEHGDMHLAAWGLWCKATTKPVFSTFGAGMLPLLQARAHIMRGKETTALKFFIFLGPRAWCFCPKQDVCLICRKCRLWLAINHHTCSTLVTPSTKQFGIGNKWNDGTPCTQAQHFDEYRHRPWLGSTLFSHDAFVEPHAAFV